MLPSLRNAAIGLCLLLTCALGFSAVPSVHATATLTVNGGEQTVGGAWDTGNITIDFNGFVETVNYGQYSSTASLASAFAAMFSRDYIAFGLYAKAGANNNQDPTVITFQLVNGNTFGPINIAGPTSSFTFSASGFASSGGTPDVGTATLNVAGSVITANYGEGSTGASIAQDLALRADSPYVTVTSEGANLFLQSKQTSGSFNYPYSLSFSTSTSFSSAPSSGQLTGSTEAAPVNVYNYTLGYDGSGNVTSMSDSVMGTWSYVNGYDSLGRLIAGSSISGPYAGQSTCWGYDSFGNRKTYSVSTTPCANSPQLTFAASYSANNQISSVSAPTGVTISYDDDGNTKYDGWNSYLYDAEGRICAVAAPFGVTGYQYDADGNRIGKGTIPGNVLPTTCDITQNGYQPATDYVLNAGGGQTSELSIVNGQAVWQHTNVAANGMLIATYDTTGLHFHLNDALGSRRVQTDPAGFPEQICQSLPFGDQLYCTGSLSTPTEHHFTGKERDTESGNDYFGARYYASSMGRWMSPDWSSNPSPIPFGNIYHPQSLNLYSYVGNNPITGFDPYGHLDCSGGATQDVACAVTAAAKAVWGWLSGGGGSSSSGNTQTATAAPDPQFSVTSRIINNIYAYRPNFSGVGASGGYSAGVGRGVAGSAGADFSFFTPDGTTSDPGDTKYVYSLSHGYTGLHWTQPGGVAMQTHDDDTVWGLGVGGEMHFNIGRSSGDMVGQSSGEQSSANGGIVYASWTHSEGWTNYNFTLGLGLKGVGYTQMLMNTTTKPF